MRANGARMRAVAVMAAAVAALAGAAGADPVGGRDARALLFDPVGVEVEIVARDRLSADDRAVLEFAAEQQNYYGAIAMAPSEGLRSEATLAAANYHDVETASAAALAGCDRARKGGDPCVIAALIRPLGWEPRRLELSADATDGLRRKYRPGTGPKAMAVSPGTGIWAVGKGPNAQADALSACTASAGRDDCRVVVADR